MDPVAIDDAMQRGNGLAALVVGAWHDLHRPRGMASPVRGGTTVMRLPAYFVPNGVRGQAYGHPIHEAVFDYAYTQPGDYLVGKRFTWFVAGQVPLAPVLCVKTSRVVSLVRPRSASSTGLGGYGGLRRDTAQPVLTEWPASVVARGSGGDMKGLPGDPGDGGWAVLLPPIPDQVVRSGDVLTDDLGRAGVVSWVELSDLGWRLAVRQVAT